MATRLEAVRSGQAAAVRGATCEAVNCHHNYVAREHHFGENVCVTRKGAVRARRGRSRDHPGHMGARSYIVRGQGNEECFASLLATAPAARCPAPKRKRRFTVADHAKATAGIECRKDEDVIDETPRPTSRSRT